MSSIKLKPKDLIRANNKYHTNAYLSSLQNRISDRFLDEYSRFFFGELNQLDEEVEAQKRLILYQQ